MSFDELPLLKWITSIVLVTTFLILLVQHKFQYWKKKKVPFLHPKFPYGNFQDLLTSKKSMGFYTWDFYNKFKTMGVKYGGIYAFTSPIFMAIDPECIKDILIKDFSSFHARGFYSNEKDQPISVHLFTVDGVKWKTLRYKFSPLFSNAKIKYMSDTVLKCTHPLIEMVSKLAKHKQCVNIKDIVTKYTMDTIGSCVFGIECNSFNDSSLYELLNKCFHDSSRTIRLIMLNSFPRVCRFFKMGFYVDTVCYFQDIIKDTVDYRKTTAAQRKDLIQVLLDMQAKEANNDFKITLSEIQAQCFFFLAAGYETSSTTLTYLFLEISQKMEIQEKIRKEVFEVLVKHGRCTYEALHDMKYLECAIDETLRKYPPVTDLNRKVVEDYILPNGEILEKGTNVIIPILGIHRDPDHYPNPELFDPDRFSEQNKNNLQQCTFLPFGDGPRNCIGIKLGMLQMKVAIAQLLSKFRFTLNKNVDPRPRYTTNFILTLSQDVLLDVEEL